jgi:hypothetical protein
MTSWDAEPKPVAVTGEVQDRKNIRTTLKRTKKRKIKEWKTSIMMSFGMNMRGDLESLP